MNVAGSMTGHRVVGMNSAARSRRGGRRTKVGLWHLGGHEAGERHPGRDLSALARPVAADSGNDPLPSRAEASFRRRLAGDGGARDIRCDGAPLAIHRTFLTRDGAGKAPVEPQKMMLGPCRGGAVRLAAPGAVLMVGEGIETCLAAMQATTLPAWAALSTSGLRALDLPDEVRDVIVLADGDDPGEAAARDCAGGGGAGPSCPDRSPAARNGFQ